MKNKKNKKKLFTLIELIIVIVVIGILAAMALPKFMRVQRNAKVGAMQRDLDVIEKAVSQYVTNTSDGSYPFKDLNGDSLINEEDLYFKTSAAPKTLIDSLLKSNGDDGSKIYQLDMDKLKPYIEKIKYPNTEYVYSPESDTAIDPIGKPDGNDNMHHIIGGGSTNDKTQKKELLISNIALGYAHILKIGEDGNLYTWGDNRNGELGIGNTDNKLTKQLVTLPNGIKPKYVKSGGDNSMVIGSDGNLYACGDNGMGALGNGKSGWDQIEVVFQKIDFPNEIKPISFAISYSHGIAIGEDGYLYAWGENKYGQLGNGSYNSSLIPTKVDLPNGIKPKSIAIGAQCSMLIGDDGELYVFGDNDRGKLGLGKSVDDTFTPTKLTLAEGVKPKEIFASNDSSMAIGDDGNLYAWGNNWYGNLGIGTIDDQYTPKKVEFPNGVKPKIISLGDYHTMAIGDDGNLYTWGYNQEGELGNGTIGNGTNIEERSPKLLNLPNGTKPKSILAGYYSSMAIGEDNNIYGWGDNKKGIFLNESLEYKLSPIKVTLP